MRQIATRAASGGFHRPVKNLQWTTPSGLRFSTAVGYQGFGSFMSESLGALIEKSCDASSPAPNLPFSPGAVSETDRMFGIDINGFTFINHGAFGASLRSGELRAKEWRRFLESQPLRYFDRTLFPHLAESSRRLAAFLNTSPRQLALIQNATVGLDAVIASVADQEPGKKILLLDTAYGSVKRMAERHFRENVVSLSIPFPLNSTEQLLELIGNTLKQHPGEFSLAAMDHMTSNTALVLPVQEISELCRSNGVRVLIDGAHGPGALPLDLNRLDCDYYVGNCHKWLSAPKSVGFLHVKDTSESQWLSPRVTSHGSQETFPANFMWDGCRDYAAALALPVVLDHWEALGPLSVRERNIVLAKRHALMLATAWQTTDAFLAPIDSPFREAPMQLVPLPASLGSGSDASYAFQQCLYHEYSIECPVKAVGNRLHVRISNHVYNTPLHYDRLKRAVIDLASLQQDSH
mmetsp:Transcript_12383/g.22961  ORF Transcript_12383/g.22961 Transcript_12383/m.22961 type:complete len:464 (+) Transcript_12383:210-1601(+)